MHSFLYGFRSSQHVLAVVFVILPTIFVAFVVNASECECRIIVKYIFIKHQKNIQEFVRSVYYSYCGVRFGDQDKSWVNQVKKIIQIWHFKNKKVTVMAVIFVAMILMGVTVNFCNATCSSWTRCPCTSASSNAR